MFGDKEVESSRKKLVGGGGWWWWWWLVGVFAMLMRSEGR